MRIYLCGPMASTTPERADGWRRFVATRLERSGFETSSPMRAKDMLRRGEVMGYNYGSYGDVPELRPQSILARDRFDVRAADMVFANMLGADGPSIGSDFEIAWTLHDGKPVVLIAADDSPYAQHPFLVAAQNVVRFTKVLDGVGWIIRNFRIYVLGKEQDRTRVEIRPFVPTDLPDFDPGGRKA